HGSRTLRATRALRRQGRRPERRRRRAPGHRVSLAALVQGRGHPHERRGLRARAHAGRRRLRRSVPARPRARSSRRRARLLHRRRCRARLRRGAHRPAARGGSAGDVAPAPQGEMRTGPMSRLLLALGATLGAVIALTSLDRTITNGQTTAEVATMLRVEWQPTTETFSRPALVGFVYNDSTFRIGSVRLRVERSEEHTSELQSRFDLVCRLLLEKKKTNIIKRDVE